MAAAGLDGARGIAQPEAVKATIRAFYNRIPMILSIVLFVVFVAVFRLERDLKGIKKDKEEPCAGIFHSETRSNDQNKEDGSIRLSRLLL